MPTYEYKCKTCGHQFERVQRFSDDPITECPDCGGVVRRIIHPTGVIFKGSGWYITDSRKSGGDSAAPAPPANGAKAEGAAPKTEGKSTESKPTESKPTESKAAGKAAPATKS